VPLLLKEGYKMRFLMLMVAVVLLAGLGVFILGASSRASDEDQIRGIMRGIEEAYKEEDIGEFMSYFSDDCARIIHHLNQPANSMEGKEAVKASFANEFNMWDDIHMTFTDMVVKVSGDTATLTCNWQMNMTNVAGEGKQVVQSGKVNAIDFRKMQGAWKITRVDNTTADFWKTVDDIVNAATAAGLTSKFQGGISMFTRLTIAQIKSGKMDELAKIYAEGIVPAARSQKGYQGAYLLTNKETGKAISITVWDSEADAIANEQSGYYKEQVAKAAPCFAAAPDREGYEIAVANAKE
jgi:ketosteroid isomerase-like protein/heme-degrading monooxygenase HmoA